MKESMSYRIFKVFNFLIMVFVGICTLYPFVYLVSQSLSSEAAIYRGELKLLPVGFTLKTYEIIFRTSDFFVSYKNTIIYAVLGTTISVLLTAILAYPMSKPELRLNKIVIPFVIFTMYFSGGLIPNYVLVSSLHMTNTIWSVLLPGAISTFYVLLMKSFFASLPRELEEAASVDGMNTYGIFVKIIIPLSKPIIATMVLFYAAAIWGNWFGPFLYLDKKELMPVASYLRQLVMSATSTHEMGASDSEASQMAATVKACAMVLSSAPIICVYPFIQKYFVQGMMIGSVKG